MSHHRKRLRQAPSLNTSFNCNIDRSLFSDDSHSTLLVPFNLEDGHLQKLGHGQVDECLDISHIGVYTNIKNNDNNKIYLNNNLSSQKSKKMKSLSSEQLGDRILQFDVKKGANRLKNMHKKFATTSNTTNKKERTKRSKSKNLYIHKHNEIKEENKAEEEDNDKENREQQRGYHQKQAVINNLNINNQIQPIFRENVLNFDGKNNKKLMKTKENKKKNIPFLTKNTRYTAEEYHNMTLAKTINTINKCLDMDKLKERYQELEKNYLTYQYQNGPIVNLSEFNEDKQLFSSQNELQHRIGLNIQTQTLQTPLISKGHSKASSFTIANIESINNELNLGLKIIDDSFQIETTQKQNYCYLDGIPYKNSFTFNASDGPSDRNSYRIHMDPQQIEDIILDQSIISPQCHELTNALNKILQSESHAKDEEVDLKMLKLVNPHTRTNTNSIVPPLHMRKQCDHYSFLESHQCECAELMDDEECDLSIQLQNQQLVLVDYVGMLVHSSEYRLVSKQNHGICCKMIEQLQTVMQQISYPNIVDIYKLQYRRMSPNLLSSKQKQLYIISQQQLYSSNFDMEKEDKVEAKCTIYKQPLVSELFNKVYNMAQVMIREQEMCENTNKCKTERTNVMTNDQRHHESADNFKERGENKILISWTMVQKLTKQLVLSVNYLNKVNLSQKFTHNDSQCQVGNLFTVNLHMLYLCRIDFEQEGAVQKYLYTFKIDLSDIKSMIHNRNSNYELLLIHNLKTIYSVVNFLANQADQLRDEKHDTKYLCYNFLAQLDKIIASGLVNTNPTTLLQKLAIHPYISYHVSTSYQKQFMNLLY